MHIMTKEKTSNPPAPATSGWTFQSAWWSNCTEGNCGDYDSHRPTSIDVPGDAWEHYLITATYGMRQKPDKSKNVAADSAHGSLTGDDPITSDWPVAFNPYIELAATHPVETNCINCHRRAGWPGHVHPSQLYPDRKSVASYLAEDGPSLLHSFELDDPSFHGLVMVDSMWAVSDRAYYPSQEGEAGSEP